MSDFDEADFIFIESDNAAEQGGLEVDSPEREVGASRNYTPSLSTSTSVDRSPNTAVRRKPNKRAQLKKNKLKRLQAEVGAAGREPADAHEWRPETAGRSRPAAGSGARRRRKRAEPPPEPDSDEDAWMDDSGAADDAEEDSELRPLVSAPLTARQRARLQRLAGGGSRAPSTPELAASPQPAADGLGGAAEPSAEMRERRQRKLERRRLQARQQRELNKRRTVRRLLTKGGEKPAGAAAAPAAPPPAGRRPPALRYVQNVHRTLLMLPRRPHASGDARWLSSGAAAVATDGAADGAPAPPAAAAAAAALLPRRGRTCSVEGCRETRRYCCRRTGAPLCHRLQCYRRNLAQHQSLA